jgi:uncharacterized protein Veg
MYIKIVRDILQQQLQEKEDDMEDNENPISILLGEKNIKKIILNILLAMKITKLEDKVAPKPDANKIEDIDTQIENLIKSNLESSLNEGRKKKKVFNIQKVKKIPNKSILFLINFRSN